LIPQVIDELIAQVINHDVHRMLNHIFTFIFVHELFLVVSILDGLVSCLPLVEAKGSGAVACVLQAAISNDM
jgi:hypothetical protein